jgi:hypothetical protein
LGDGLGEKDIPVSKVEGGCIRGNHIIHASHGLHIHTHEIKKWQCTRLIINFQCKSFYRV